jgi:ABC-2 type transport system permease protein
MIAILTVARWEWFKLRRRWLPWILLAILVLFSQLGPWGGFFAYRNLGMQTAGPSPLAGLRGAFTLPGSIDAALAPVQLIGPVLLAVLAASVIAAEYGFGTLRPIVARGTPRWAVLGGKLVMILAAALAALIVVAGVTALSSALAGSLAGPATGLGGAGWADAALALARTWTSFVPYLALVGAATVLTRSTSAGMGIGLGYPLAEPILTGLLPLLDDWFRTAAAYMPMRVISAWTGRSGPFPLAQSSLGTGEIAALLALYTVTFTAAAFWLFQRRDIRGASGG